VFNISNKPEMSHSSPAVPVVVDNGPDVCETDNRRPSVLRIVCVVTAYSQTEGRPREPPPPATACTQSYNYLTVSDHDWAVWYRVLNEFEFLRRFYASTRCPTDPGPAFPHAAREDIIEHCIANLDMSDDRISTTSRSALSTATTRQRVSPRCSTQRAGRPRPGRGQQAVGTQRAIPHIKTLINSNDAAWDNHDDIAQMGQTMESVWRLTTARCG